MSYWFRYLLYRNKYRLAAGYRAAAISGLVVVLFFFLYYIPGSGVLSKIIGPRDFSLFDIAVSWTERDPRGMMRSAVQVIAWAGNQEDYPEEMTPRSLITAILAPFRANLNSPPDLLASEMPAFLEYKRTHDVPAVTNEDVASEGSSLGVAKELSKEALLAIYYTHTGETYSVTDGKDRIQGKKGGITEAGFALKELLEKEYGIRVAYDDRVNDKNYSLSYVESEKTARQILEKNNNVKILLDIHRDAGKPREQCLVKVGGKEVAPILFIVGSDARAPFPTWRSNYEYAVKLSKRINMKYPGLSIGVRVKEGRYNQFLHPRALLVEIGSVNNSTEEAVETGKMLAHILAQEILELAADKMQKNSDSAVQSPKKEVAGEEGQDVLPKEDGYKGEEL